MKWSTRVIRSAASAAVLACGVVTLTAQQPASKPAQPSKPAPRTASGKPDLSGVWDHPYVPDMTKTAKDQRGLAELPYTPEGLKEWKAYDAANGDYTGSCLPYGMTRSFNAPYPIQFMQSDTYVAFLFELNTWFHVVPIDGRPMPKELEPKWFGTSVGRWDGDTLVVETAGFYDWTKLDTIGHPHTENLRLVQTFRRTDFDHMVYTVTVTDPDTYTKPWTNERTFTRMEGGLIEYSCEENNKDLWEGRVKAPKYKP